jgi:hypothetical protein
MLKAELHGDYLEDIEYEQVERNEDSKGCAP